MKAEVAFCYGWTDREINKMDIQTFYQYYISSISIKAKERVYQMNICAYPHMKKSDASNLFKSTKRLIDKYVDRTEGSVLSYKSVIDNIARKLNGGGR